MDKKERERIRAREYRQRERLAKGDTGWVCGQTTPAYMPTPEQIKEMAAQLRAKRAPLPALPAEPYQPHVYRVADIVAAIAGR